MAKITYPLKEILEVKHRRVENAEKVVKEKRVLLEQEQEKLKQREAERDKVLNHYNDKLEQLRQELSHLTTSPTIQQMKVYIKLVKEKLKVEEKKVADQKEQVDLAEKNLELAKKDLALKRQEVDKLLTHRKDWELEMRKEYEIIEGREQDDLGNIIFLTNSRKANKQ